MATVDLEKDARARLAEAILQKMMAQRRVEGLDFGSVPEKYRGQLGPMPMSEPLFNTGRPTDIPPEFKNKDVMTLDPMTVNIGPKDMGTLSPMTLDMKRFIAMPPMRVTATPPEARADADDLGGMPSPDDIAQRIKAKKGY